MFVRYMKLFVTIMMPITAYQFYSSSLLISSKKNGSMGAISVSLVLLFVAIVILHNSYVGELFQTLFWYLNAKSLREDMVTMIPDQLKTKKITSSVEFIEREAFKGPIAAFLASTFGSCMVVYGCQGVGKSTLIEHHLKNQEAVIKLDITPSTVSKGSNILH